MGLRCADCAKPMAQVAKSLPQGKARCQPCRRLKPTRKPRPEKVRRTKAAIVRTPKRAYTKRVAHTCTDCDEPTWSTRCRPCYDAHVKAQADPEGAAQRKRERAIRQRRDRAAPGLTMQQRRRLGAEWRRQSRRCTYCDALATQVDHVVPLALGGTHYEGNLTPCCAACNLRKSDSLVIEWKHKVRVKRAWVEPPPLPAKPKPRVRWGAQSPLLNLQDIPNYKARPKTPRQCAKCGAVFVSHTANYCSKRCQPSTMSGAQQRRRQRESMAPGYIQSLAS